MPKTRIYRRAFNPKEGEPKVNQLVATFTVGMEQEAELLMGILHKASTTFAAIETNFCRYRYSSEVVPDAIISPSEKEGIQVDVSKAKPTKRPITYQLSWETKHGECHCIAWHKLYGSIRGTVEDSPQGRRLFNHRIMSVWPNAEIATT